MKAVVSVLGKDRTGIIARVSSLLYEEKANIEDISQTIMGGLFTMVMLIEVGEDARSFQSIQSRLGDLEKEMGIQIRMQHAEIFDAMHRV